MLKQALSKYIVNNQSTVYLAFSGGVDSSVLLHILNNLTSNIIAIHINHDANKNSSKWQEHCTQVCKQLNIALKTFNLNLTLGGNFEARAREARYKVFANILRTQSDYLFTAQHQDDQVETVLLRLLRGSGPNGLSAMSEIRGLGCGQLVRPWLNISKAEIIKYAQTNNIKWLEDDSNLDNKYDRNFLRNQIIPALRSHWPALNQTISRSAKLCQLTTSHHKNNNYSCSFEISEIKNLTLDEASNKIYWWLKNLCQFLPSQKIINNIVNEVSLAKKDAKPQISWQYGQVRRYQNKLYFMQEPQDLTTISTEYILEDAIYLKDYNLTLINLSKQKLLIKFPQGGETILLNGHHKRLKKIFQQQKIKPWLRPKVPLVYLEGELMQAVGICAKKELVKCKQ